MRRPDRNVSAGRCRACQVRTVRGFDDTMTVVEVEIWPIDEPTEWTEVEAGRPTFLLSWAKVGMTLTRRTERDRKLRPAGFNHDRIVPIHRCRESQ